ncbi:hypothetical protein B0H13DRAFT_2361169 [Mycena leptocephala]|nr:hypothetical protein B0H13DRAFT_2361169 [Mycena leptocephala]
MEWGARAYDRASAESPRRMLGNPNAGWGGAPSLMVEPVPRPLSRQMGGMLGNPGNPNAAWSGAPALTTERPLSRQGGMLGNPNAAGANAGWGGVPPFRWSLLRVH